MFKYDKEIDKLSHKMIEGVDAVWGNKLKKFDKKDGLLTVDLLINYLDQYITKYGGKIISRFNKLTDLSFDIKDFSFYVNTTSVSMHNGQDKYISIGLNHSFISYPTVLIHEIFHIYFSHYIYSEKFLRFNNVSKTQEIISPQEENDVKEIITVIINELFEDIIDQPDIGYPDHKEIREKISDLWENYFDKWISNVLKIYKKEG